MSISNSKCWYSNICLHLLKRAVPLSTVCKRVKLFGSICKLRGESSLIMEQHALKIINNCLNSSIYSYLETFSGESSNQYLNGVHFFNTNVN